MSRQHVSREQVLRGPLVRTLLILAWPTVTTAALQGIVTALDGVMVARLGETAVAAVASARQVFQVILGLGAAIGASTSILVAQAIGRGDYAAARHIATQALISFSLLMSALLLPLGWYGAPPVMRGLAPDDHDVVAAGIPYLRVLVLSLAPSVMTFGALGALRGAGDVRTPLRLTFWTNIITVILTYALIFGLPGTLVRGWGLIGAAWGSLGGRLVILVMLYAMLASGKLVLRLEHPRRWMPDWPLLRQMAWLGGPQALSAILLNLWGLLAIRVLYMTPEARAAVAAYSLSMLLRNLGVWVTWGLGEATLAMVGQNWGGRRLSRARRVGWQSARVALLYLVPVSVAMALFGPWLMGAMLVDTPEREAAVLLIGTRFLWSQVLAMPLLGAGMAFEGALRGTGDTTTPLWINILSLYVCGLPLAWVLAPTMGADGVWLGMAVGHGVRGGLGAWFWARAVRSWSRTQWTERLAGPPAAEANR